MDQEDIRQIIRIQLTDAEILVTDLHLDIAIEYYNLNGSVPDIDYIVGRVVEQTMPAAVENDNTNNNNNNEPEHDEDDNNESNNNNADNNDSINSETENTEPAQPIQNMIVSPSNIIRILNNTPNDVLNNPQNIYFRISRQSLISNQQEELPPIENDEERLSQLHNMIVKKVIENIDDIKLDIVKEKHNANECIVCYDNFVETDLVRILECKHMAHRNCIDNYLLKESHLCPMCKRPAGKYQLINI